MAEFGLVAARRELGMKELLAIISDFDDARLPSMARELLVLQIEHLRAIERRIADFDGRLLQQARNDEAARRLTAIPGIGPVIATAMVATVVDAQIFPNGRSFAAWLGLRTFASTRPVVGNGCSKSANGATAICADS